MGRIRHTTLAFGLSETGYWCRGTAFSSEGVLRQVELEQLTWRELHQILEDLTDTWRPGVELLGDGIQESLFD